MDLNLFENQCIADVGEVEGARIRRILWVPPVRQVVCVIELGEARALPIWYSYEELLKGIEDHEFSVLEVDPAAASWRPDSKLSPAERAIRDKRSEIIAPLVSDPERSILDENLRGRLIKERSRETRVSASHIYTFLRLWWQLGQLPNALVPDVPPLRRAGRGARGRYSEARPSALRQRYRSAGRD